MHNPTASPGKPLISGGSVGGSTPVAKQPHQRKPRDSKAAARRKLALPSGEGGQPSESGTSPQPDFTPVTPTPDQSDPVHGSDNTSYETMPASVREDISGGGMPSLPPLHLSKAQHRSVRTDDGEEVHVLVSPVRSQGGDDSPSSPSRLPDSVLKAMCNMGKAFLSRYGNTTHTTLLLLVLLLLLLFSAYAMMQLDTVGICTKLYELSSCHKGFLRGSQLPCTFVQTSTGDRS